LLGIVEFAHAHAAQAERGYFEAAFAENSLIHDGDSSMPSERILLYLHGTQVRDRPMDAVEQSIRDLFRLTTERQKAIQKQEHFQ
jgi:hypothetical protein